MGSVAVQHNWRQSSSFGSLSSYFPMFCANSCKIAINSTTVIASRVTEPQNQLRTIPRLALRGAGINGLEGLNVYSDRESSGGRKAENGSLNLL